MAESLYTLGKAIRVFQKSFNSIEYRLCGHGAKVSYMMYKMLRELGTYSEREIIKITLISFFHDIGAYKTEELEDLLDFEIIDPHSHAIYGYLFLKYISPINELEEIVLYHHLKARDFQYIKTNYKEEALLLHFIDRIDILIRSNEEVNYENLKWLTKDIISEDIIELFINLDKRENICGKIRSNTYKEEFYQYLDCFELTLEERIDFLKMLVSIIDFRSSETVTHSVVTAAITRILCEKLNYEKEEIDMITLAALFHDIGKITIPTNILEKEGRLTGEEMEIMKRHVIVSKLIVDGLGFDDIGEIIVLHHEKLDGSGYPYGLMESQIEKDERIISVADIFSALTGRRSYKEAFNREKVIEILSQLANEGKIDSDITTILIENYDTCINEANKVSAEHLKLYNFLNSKFEKMKSNLVTE